MDDERCIALRYQVGTALLTKSISGLDATRLARCLKDNEGLKKTDEDFSKGASEGGDAQ